jgi:hypothetical protein
LSVASIFKVNNSGRTSPEAPASRIRSVPVCDRLPGRWACHVLASKYAKKTTDFPPFTPTPYARAGGEAKKRRILKS